MPLLSRETNTAFSMHIYFGDTRRFSYLHCSSLLHLANLLTQPQYKMAHGTWTSENDIYIIALKKCSVELTWNRIAEIFRWRFESQATSKDVESRWNKRLKHQSLVSSYDECYSKDDWPVYAYSSIGDSILEINGLVRDLDYQGVQLLSVCTTLIEINPSFLPLFLFDFRLCGAEKALLNLYHPRNFLTACCTFMT